jgi:hypothetical protein
MEGDPDLDGYWTAEGQRSSSSGVMRRAAYTTVPARSQQERPTMEEIMKAYPAYRIHSVQTPPSSASDGDGTDRIPPQRENSVESDLSWMLSSSASEGPPEGPPEGPSRWPSEGQPEQFGSASEVMAEVSRSPLPHASDETDYMDPLSRSERSRSPASYSTSTHTDIFFFIIRYASGFAGFRIMIPIHYCPKTLLFRPKYLVRYV